MKHYNKKMYEVKKPVDLNNLPEIKGYDFEKGFELDKFIQSLSTSGIQAANLGSAISLVNVMIREEAPIFMSFTANMISSGIREIISYLVKNKKVAVLCTSGGGVEEDAIKAHMPFRVGDFNAKGEMLFDAGVGRIGNIYTTNEHYSYFEFFIREVFEELLKQKKKDKLAITPSKICRMMGKLIGEKKEYNEECSYLYWAYKNSIPVYSPGIIDGAIGDIAYYFRKQNPDFVIDAVADHVNLIDYVVNCKKTAGIILGGGISKHYMLNSQIFREGFDYSVYISTATEHDASDSGGNQEEAISWAKIKPNAPRVKVYSEASIAFPLLVAASFAKK
ncbi:deoxyhypusine synthase family protein [Candidatus Woesearchaeota archaeon]|nr:deoxyhypusine synthase family protein [Candidatus Woesearchaeota archaeon]